MTVVRAGNLMHVVFCKVSGGAVLMLVLAMGFLPKCRTPSANARHHFLPPHVKHSIQQSIIRL
jgi:hypothetical protein